MKKYQLTIQYLAEGENSSESFFQSTFYAADIEKAKEIQEHLEQLTTGGFEIVPHSYRPYESILTEVD